MRQKKFATTALDPSKKEFFVYILYLRAMISIHLICKAQIVLLIDKNVTISAKDLNFVNIFSKNQL